MKTVMFSAAAFVLALITTAGLDAQDASAPPPPPAESTGMGPGRG